MREYKAFDVKLEQELSPHPTIGFLLHKHFPSIAIQLLQTTETSTTWNSNKLHYNVAKKKLNVGLNLLYQFSTFSGPLSLTLIPIDTPNLDWLSVQRISTRFPTMAFLHPCSYDQHPPACPIMLQVKMCWLAGKSSDLHVELLSLNCTKFKSGVPHPVFDNCIWRQTASAPKIIFSNL
jgi:hypothetical protein